MTAVFLRSWGCRLLKGGVGWRGGAGIFRFPPKLTVSHFQMEDLKIFFYGEIREKKTRFEIPRILAKYRRLAMHVKEMQPSVSVLDATDRERTQRIVASFIINLFKSLSESAQDFDSQQPFTRSPPFAPPLIRCARQGQAAAAARRLCAHVALVRSLT